MIIELWRGGGRISIIRRGSAAHPRRHELLQAVVECDEFPADADARRALLALPHRGPDEFPFVGRLGRRDVQVAANEAISSPPEAA